MNMMAVDPHLDRLRALRTEVEQACVLLASPTAQTLDRCSCLLEAARLHLVSYAASVSLAQIDPSVVAEAQRLQVAVHRAGQLLRNAWEYHTHWTQCWTALGAGYSPAGMPIAVERRGMVSLTG